MKKDNVIFLHDIDKAVLVRWIQLGIQRHKGLPRSVSPEFCNLACSVTEI